MTDETVSPWTDSPSDWSERVVDAYIRLIEQVFSNMDGLGSPYEPVDSLVNDVWDALARLIFGPDPESIRPSGVIDTPTATTKLVGSSFCHAPVETVSEIVVPAVIVFLAVMGVVAVTMILSGGSK